MTTEATTILVQRARKGDRYAFAALVERWTAPVHCIALARTIDHHTAEDIVQATFLKAWRKLGDLREPAAFGGWLRQIARSTCRDHTQKIARRPPVSPLSAVPQPTANTASPEDHVLTLETRQALHAALLDLPDADRELLLLYYLEGQSTAELAEGLGLNPAAVRQRISRIRRSLTASLGAALAIWISHIHLGDPFQQALQETLAASTRSGSPLFSVHPTAIAAASAAAVLVGVAILVGAGSPDDPAVPPTTASSHHATPAPFRLAQHPDGPRPERRPSTRSGAASTTHAPSPSTFADAIADVLEELPEDTPEWRDPHIECTNPIDSCELWITLPDPVVAPDFLVRLSEGFQSRGYVLNQFRPLDAEETADEDELRIGVYLSLRTRIAAPPPEPAPPTGELVEDLAEIETFIMDWLMHYPGVADAAVDCSQAPGACTLQVTASVDVTELDMLDLYLDISELGYNVTGHRLDPKDDTDLPSGMYRHHMGIEIRQD